MTGSDPSGQTRRMAVEAALKRLYLKGYGGGGAAAVVRSVLDSVVAAGAADEPLPPPEDVLDGLTLFPEYRALVDRQEVALLEAAHQAGASWERVGVALGYRTAEAEQAALDRLECLGSPRVDPVRVRRLAAEIDERVRAGTATTNDIWVRGELGRVVEGLPPMPEPRGAADGGGPRL